MYILGINAYHGDSSACLLKDGVVISASEEERFRRIKHWAGLPSLAIQFCLRENRIHGNNIGSLNIDQLEKNIKAASLPLPDAVWERYHSYFGYNE